MVRIMRMRSQSVLVGMVLCEEVRKKCSQALIPSLCGILVYSDETSSVSSLYSFYEVGMSGLEIPRKNGTFVITSSRRPHNCKTGHFTSWKGRERQGNVQK